MEKHIQEWWNSLTSKDLSDLIHKYPPSSYSHLKTEDEQITHIYNMEHKEETVEEAAEKYAGSSREWGLTDNGGNEFFKLGASWQKEKDDELIKEMINVILDMRGKMYSYCLSQSGTTWGLTEYDELIEKANNHLQQ